MRYPKPGHALTCLAGLAWLALGVELVTRVLDQETTSSLRTGALALAVVAGLTRACERMEAAGSSHADRVERAMRDHTKAMIDHVLALERFFGMGLRGHVLASLQVAGERGAYKNPRDTGPFRVYSGGN